MKGECMRLVALALLCAPSAALAQTVPSLGAAQGFGFAVLAGRRTAAGAKRRRDARHQHRLRHMCNRATRVPDDHAHAVDAAQRNQRDVLSPDACRERRYRTGQCVIGERRARTHDYLGRAHIGDAVRRRHVYVHVAGNGRGRVFQRLSLLAHHYRGGSNLARGIRAVSRSGPRGPRVPAVAVARAGEVVTISSATLPSQAN
jgi:hypothetical protein